MRTQWGDVVSLSPKQLGSEPAGPAFTVDVRLGLLLRVGGFPQCTAQSQGALCQEAMQPRNIPTCFFAVSVAGESMTEEAAAPLATKSLRGKRRHCFEN
jgi:hypothetical protein